MYIGAKYKDRKSNKYNWSQQLCSSSYMCWSTYTHTWKTLPWQHQRRLRL